MAVLRNEALGKKITRYTILGILAFLFLLPFYVVVRNAFATDDIITSDVWVLWPIPMHILDNFRSIFQDSRISILSGIRVSVIVATLQTTLHLLFASMAGYALARIPFKYRQVVFTFVVSTMMIPNYVTFIPTYMIVKQLGLVNTLPGIILPAVFWTFSAFMYRQFFLDFPVEIEEQGILDGMGYFDIWARLVMPNALGVTVSLGIIDFFRAWRAFLWPLVVARDEGLWTIQVVLSQYLTSQNVVLYHIFLGAFIALFPMVVLFFIFQRFIMEGVAMSGVKG